ncbi:hypothetical protein RHSIM_Rhsim04G0236400 [Rhododendron simsii]|uniref:Uncharacterized protein n=1 Tax=Rhododendron simsii TaxID=118357 RepID=A0A834LPG7_RHOSS|nr:hypothetical protein RHSIM_Rhsim04G0236400 [Rhododendron simsii]
MNHFLATLKVFCSFHPGTSFFARPQFTITQPCPKFLTNSSNQPREASVINKKMQSEHANNEVFRSSAKATVLGRLGKPFPLKLEQQASEAKAAEISNGSPQLTKEGTVEEKGHSYYQM